MNHPRQAELDDAPVMARDPLPPGLPPVHPLPLLSEPLPPHGGLALQHVLRRGEPVVRGEDDGGAQRGAAQVVQLRPLRYRVGGCSDRSVGHCLVCDYLSLCLW